ncbi:DMT family transporter [Bradyrhizobium sp.]|jgi:drug/metabolite transporter (DMT)-like permease|uniref:DMT family transporter n=1 Tax=Bradyrhizobium sp. TaxID=376 RepID=UPI003C421AE4
MISREVRGMLWGLLGVVAFSLTLPATRAAAPSLGIGFVSLGRTIGAGILAVIILWWTRQPLPRRSDLVSIVITSLGVVIGFPFLTTLAMAHAAASHGAIVVGLLPLSTAVAGVWLARERPSLGFWLTSLIATAILLTFVLQESDGHLGVADAALMGAVVCAALGYAAGGQLAARLGSWQVICWALAIALPGLVVVALVVGIRPQLPAPPSAWIGFAYVTLVSQLAGFLAWYRGLAMGGIARVSQTQLLQVFFTLIASAALLGEAADARLIGYAAAVAVVVALGTRLRIARSSSVIGAAK